MSKKGRRSFIKNLIAAGAIPATLPALGSSGVSAGNSFLSENSPVLEPPINQQYYQPLENIRISGKGEGKLVVYDAEGKEYFQGEYLDGITFMAGGSLGDQLILMEDRRGDISGILFFKVQTETFIDDEDGEFRKLLTTLYRTMTSSNYGIGRKVFYNGEFYTYFSSWFQDHLYAMKGMRYFYPEWKSGIELYARAQRDDGMLHDNYKHRYEQNGTWSHRFDYGNFVYIPEDPRSDAIFVRVPVENIAEFSFIEGVYSTWQITGDDQWMAGLLDHCIKAVNYATSSPYRWSGKYQLLKRGYTIDIWDFQSIEDSRIAGNDTMRIYLDKTRFGIMYGDNVRMAASCDYLAEMLMHTGRKAEAEKIKSTGNGIRNRIDELSWNGEFYTHHIPEDPGVRRNLGVDESTQVTLSNAYALSAGITHDKAVAIIKTYQRILREKPESGLAEWYCCYPPFERGFHIEKWNYMNGGITPIVAGELARGAFEHGYEDYGVDILRRVYGIAQMLNDKLEGCYKGAIEEEPERSFTKLRLEEYVNVALGDGNEKVPGWTDEPGNNMEEFPTGDLVFENIPFRIIEPEKNELRSVLVLSGDPRLRQSLRIPLGKKAASIYFLHVLQHGSMAGNVKFVYEDGSEYLKYLSQQNGAFGNGWWYPNEPIDKKGIPHMKLAWTGKNRATTKIGSWVFGLNNPHPEKTIEHIELEGMKDSTRWLILGMTLSDKEVYFRPSIVSTIPAHWGAAEVTFGLMEGLAGVISTSKAFKTSRVSPRWSFADKKNLRVSVKYEASSGYVSYEYKDASDHSRIILTSNSENIDFRLPFRKGSNPKSLSVNGRERTFSTEKIEGSDYLVTELTGTGVYEILINWT